MRNVLVLALLAMLTVGGARAQHGSIDASEKLFTVLAAINMAGYDADLDSPTNHPLRRQVREYLASRKLACVERLKAFYEEKETGNWTSEFSQYVSFALVTGGPPTFELGSLTYMMPPDVQRLKDFGPLLAEFYREADIASIYQKIQPAIEEFAAQYQEPVSRSLFELNGYLRNPTSGVSGRSFQIILSVLGAPNQIQTRSYNSNYFVVVTPSVEPQIEDIRYTYLHYVLEPVASRAADALERVRPLGDYALGAPYLPEYYKHDFQLLATSSLIKAIEARLARLPEGDRRVRVDEAYRQGYILAPALYEQLPDYEKQDQAMRLYFRQMLDSISLEQEEARAQNLEFDQQEHVRRVKAAVPPEPKRSETEKLLDRGEALYRERDLDEAREVFLQVIRATDQRSMKARAYYGLARIATLQNEPELAVSLFERALGSSPRPRDQAWILIYLGRLSDLAGEAEKAAGYYRDALAVDGASEKARQMAQEGTAGAFRRPGER